MKMFGFIIVVLLFCNMAFFSFAIGAENLAGLWLFNDGSGNIAKDSSGNKLDGKLSTNQEWVKSGKFGGALKFVAAENPFVQVSPIPYNNAMTITSWANNTGTVTGNNGLIQIQAGAPAISTTEKIIGVWFATATKIIWGRIITDAGATNNFPQVKTLDPNVWYNIAVVVDPVAQEARQYVNAEEVGKVAYVGGKLKKYDCLNIGRQGTESWDGMIDEVAIFNKALSVAELQDVMKGINITVSSVESKHKIATEWGMIKSAQ
jgi:hypothetical protein